MPAQFSDNKIVLKFTLAYSENLEDVYHARNIECSQKLAQPISIEHSISAFPLAMAIACSAHCGTFGFA
jgi:hypothetical protein